MIGETTAKSAVSVSPVESQIRHTHDLAVTVGFEPTVDFHPHNFSRVAPSAARTRHRELGYYTDRLAVLANLIRGNFEH